MTEILINGPQGKLQGYYKHIENSQSIALILHPRNCIENSMDNNVVLSLFDIYSKKGFSTLRINFRGIQKSEGETEEDGLGELSDAATALDWLQEQNQDINNCWIGGIDFGAWIGSQLLMRRPEIVGFINVATPIKDFDFSFLSPCPASGLIIHPNKQVDIEQKNVSSLVKKLASQKKIKISYKKINSDINFKNKENEIKKISDNFVSDIQQELSKSKELASG
jgi:alpha/beta superfamily hydrolase|tara:strand:+ start:1775 stop:2443 length:669 start_codon:yes stop_codon:yes gene_type:complete